MISWGSREKGVHFCDAYFVLRDFCNVCILSQCIEYSINFHNIYTFTYQKTLLHTLFCLFLKPSEAFSGSLSQEFQSYF